MAQSLPRFQTRTSPHSRSTFITNRRLAIGALIFANLIWGTSFVATKPVLDTLPPATLAVARLIVALAVLLPFMVASGRKPSFGKNPALLGITGVFLVFMLQNMGLNCTSASNGALLQSCVPVFTVTLAYLFLREKATLERVMAIALSVFGVAITVAFTPAGSSPVSLVGDALILAGAVALAVYFVIGRRLFTEIDTLSLVAGASIYGLVFLMPMSIYEFVRQNVSMPDTTGILCIL